MKFVLISDVHVDANRWMWNYLDPFLNYTDTLVVAGDISNEAFVTASWLKNAKNLFANVLWVPGNHDFYNTHQTMVISPTMRENYGFPVTISEKLAFYERFSSDHDIHFLNHKTVIVHDVPFIGATGWHDFVAGEQYSYEEQTKVWYDSNERCIRWENSYTPNHKYPENQAHFDYEFIKLALEKTEEKAVVVTHHVPHRKLKYDRQHDIIWTKSHGYFVNTLMEKIDPSKIKIWCFGHTHERKMVDVNGVTYACNPKGYIGENPGWTPVLIDLNDF